MIVNENIEKIQLNFNNDVIIGKGKLTFNILILIIIIQLKEF